MALCLAMDDGFAATRFTESLAEESGYSENGAVNQACFGSEAFCDTRSPGLEEACPEIPADFIEAGEEPGY
ncbi:hypothetical protein [Salininema proteolyticum]|uniref:Uncharacterized protein n=1 Tax=Salininema proteolyticum TaxID=1607685 RepID=A0ABV8TWG4_9ACTN